ncbi:MAG: pyrroline-5-carboxylate reductase [Phycisphaerae bacterium]|nr:pyrroline-5-carboxylate reductase [Phycisphaerae bacterium]
METRYELGVIGAGNMAEAIVRGVIRGGFLSADCIVASDLSPARRDRLAELGVRATADNAVPASCGRVVVALKPQVIPAALPAVAEVVKPDATVVSIAAGITTAAIDRLLGGRGRIVRVMPNTPMMVGQGMSAACAGPRATRADLDWTGAVFATAGRCVVVDESAMDGVTAVSGSGPAYVFYLAEAMIAAGVAEGLDPATARTLAVQTCAGAAALLAVDDTPPQTLRANVTSPNGTTQRAIETLDHANAKTILVAAIRAAAARSRELGK